MSILFVLCARLPGALPRGPAHSAQPGQDPPPRALRCPHARCCIHSLLLYPVATFYACSCLLIILAPKQFLRLIGRIVAARTHLMAGNRASGEAKESPVRKQVRRGCAHTGVGSDTMKKCCRVNFTRQALKATCPHWSPTPPLKKRGLPGPATPHLSLDRSPSTVDSHPRAPEPPSVPHSHSPPPTAGRGPLLESQDGAV